MLPTPAQLSTFFVENAPATNEAFRSVYENAVGFYLGGPDGSLADWEEARECLEECLRLRPSDGPSRTILRYIQEHAQPDGSPPQSWGGFRPLDSK
mmetsp:Transcript_8792/g.20751  ORF Transcript_8792/g.20751 Transcript_8792/m.20751 type:complete len:96 (+) Transcript_8792:913-1200(+)